MKFGRICIQNCICHFQAGRKVLTNVARKPVMTTWSFGSKFPYLWGFRPPSDTLWHWLRPACVPSGNTIHSHNQPNSDRPIYISCVVHRKLVYVYNGIQIQQYYQQLIDIYAAALYLQLSEVGCEPALLWQLTFTVLLVNIICHLKNSVLI